MKITSSFSSNEYESEKNPMKNFLVHRQTSMAIVTSDQGKIDFTNERRVAVLDRYKVNDRDTVHILIKIAEALGHDVCNLVFNRNSTKNGHQIIRQNVSENLK